MTAAYSYPAFRSQLCRFVFAWLGTFFCVMAACDTLQAAENAMEPRRRVLVSTDIGGTDPDDFQSMVHFLVYADCFDVEGLVSSPYGPGRKQHILDVIDHYERDYANLRSHSARYPKPDTLRALTKEGALEDPGQAGFSEPTEGSQWIVQCARRPDPRPLWVLVWGGIEDVAQALHDAPDIESKLRVYFIGGPNKKWSVNAYHYIERHHPRLWLIEANATYRGWFVGGNQAGEWGNREFVSRHIAGHGALGNFFATQLGGTMKMGDTPAVVYLLHDMPEDPTRPGWGGQFVRAWERPRVVFERHTTAADRVEQFGVLELALEAPATMTRERSARLMIENQALVGELDGRGKVRFRFSPKDAKTWSYVVRSDVTELDGKTGAFTSFQPSAGRAQQPAAEHPNWWTDDPSPAAAEGPHNGAKTVSRWREAFLRDFATRMDRCAAPAVSSDAVLQTSIINPDAPYPECHASTIVELSPGKLAAAWFGGTKERNPDVGIWFTRQENGQWQPAVEVANGVQSSGPRMPTWNPVLFQAPQGPLFLFYKVGPSPSRWWGMVITSTDAGKTWSAPRRLPDGILGPMKNKPVVLPDGAWLAASSTEGNPDGWLVHFELSRDAGVTWERIGPVNKGPSFDAIQPSVLLHRDRALQALCRSKQGVVAQTWSRDGGRTWTPLTATELPNPNSGTDAVTLADGRQVIVYNHSAHRIDEPKGNRYPLDVAVSRDGLKWEHALTLETEPVGSGYAYPAVIQTADGRVHVTYTLNRKRIKHVVLDPARLPLR